MDVLQGLLTAPAWQSFALLAGGWALATDRHTITPSLWLTGATTVQHCSPCYGFLGCPLSHRRWPRWGVVIRRAAPCVPAGEVMQGAFDETTKKTAGRHSEGLERYRHGAGSARQAYRTLRGWHCVLGRMRLPLPPWPGHHRSLPVGLARYRQPAQAQALTVPDRSRRPLARALLDCMSEPVPGRPLRALAEGGSATKDSGRGLPASAPVGGRFPSHATLDAGPPTLTQKRRGAPRKKGDVSGAPKPLATTETGWAPHPRAVGAEVHAGSGRWHAVWPGRLLQGVSVRRAAPRCLKTPGRHPPRPAVAALFTTALTLSLDVIGGEARDRWAVELDLRDTHACEGLGQEQGRTWQRSIGVNPLRWVMAAARTRWCLTHVARGAAWHLGCDRPWYRQQVAPSQREVVWACRKALHQAGIFPISRCTSDRAENHEEPDSALPLAA
jgi:hypothetical protein